MLNLKIDIVLWLSGLAAEAVVLCLLLFRGIWRGFPFFFAYSIWTIVGNAGLYALIHMPVSAYQNGYFVFTLVDSALLFCIITEIALAILRPVRSSLPRITPLVVAGLVLALGAAIWPFATFSGASQGSHIEAILTHLEQDVSVLRILTFLILVAFSQFLSLGFRDREMQIATGLGFYSLVGVAVAMLHTHQATMDQYIHWNRIVVASYLCSMVYWVFSFSQKEAERREMSPQVQSLLLAVAGTARANRVALANSRSRSKEDHK